VFWDLFDQLGQERVFGSRQNKGVVDAGGVGGGSQEWDLKEGIQVHATSDVHVKVDAAVVVQEKVAKDVGPLNRLAVLYVGLVHLWGIVERIPFLGIVLAYPSGCVIFRPELVLPVGVKSNAAVACSFVFGEPVRTIAVMKVVLVEENLVDDFGHEVIRGCGVIRRSTCRVRRVVDTIWV